MQTQIIDGTSPRANDQQVVAAVKAKARGNGGGATMVIGVRNETGAIYRRFHVTGLGDFMGAVGALQDLGLNDELSNETSMRDGCDAIFA